MPRRLAGGQQRLSLLAETWVYADPYVKRKEKHLQQRYTGGTLEKFIINFKSLTFVSLSGQIKLFKQHSDKLRFRASNTSHIFSAPTNNIPRSYMARYKFYIVLYLYIYIFV